MGLRGEVGGRGLSRALTGHDPGAQSSRLLTPQWYRARRRQGFSFSDPGGRKEKCSPSPALSPESSAIPVFFEFHPSREHCPKWGTGQKSRVREKHGSGARHTYPARKTAEPTVSDSLSTSPLPSTGAGSRSGDSTQSLKQRPSAEGLCRAGAWAEPVLWLWESWAGWGRPLAQR